MDKATLGKRAFYFFWLTLGAWFGMKSLSMGLWNINERTVPIVPVFNEMDWAASIDEWLGPLIFITFLVLFTFKKRWLAWTLLFLEIIACLLDQTRWHPWEYQCLLTLALFLLCDTKRFLELSGFLIAMIFVYSGLHKCSGAFLSMVWDKMMLKQLFGITVESPHFRLWHYAGVSIAIIEVAIGLGLIFLRDKRPAVIGAMLSMVVIMLLVGPWTTGKNAVLMPWNALIAVGCFLLFWKNPVRPLPEMKTVVGMTTAVLIGVMPAFGFIGIWPHYLSFDLYTGKPPYLVMRFDTVPHRLEKYVKEGQRKDGMPVTIRVMDITADELGALPYPETSYHRRFATEWRRAFPEDSVTFVEYRYPFRKEDIRVVR